MTPRRVIYPLGRVADLRPRLRGTFSGSLLFRVCAPENSAVSLLVDGGATFKVAGAEWSSRQKTLPGYGVVARGMGQHVLPSLGRGALNLKFEAMAGPPTCGTLDVSNGLRDAVRPISSASAVALAEAQRQFKRAHRTSRFTSIDDVHDAIARLGIVRNDVLRMFHVIATGVHTFPVPADFEPLEEQFRIAAHRRRPLHHTLDDASRVFISVRLQQKYAHWRRLGDGLDPAVPA